MELIAGKAFQLPPVTHDVITKSHFTRNITPIPLCMAISKKNILTFGMNLPAHRGITIPIYITANAVLCVVVLVSILQTCTSPNCIAG